MLSISYLSYASTNTFPFQYYFQLPYFVQLKTQQMETYKKPSSLDYQTGAVKGFSGKGLIALKNGDLKMIKVDAHARYPIHTHPKKTEYIFVLEGKPTITIADERFEGTKEDFFILPTGAPHGIENNTHQECILLVGAINN